MSKFFNLKQILASDYTDKFLALKWDSTLDTVEKTLPRVKVGRSLALYAHKGFGKTTVLNALGSLGYRAADGDILRVIGSMAKVSYQGTVSEFTKEFPDIWTDKFTSRDWIDQKYLAKVLNGLEFYSVSEFRPTGAIIKVRLVIPYDQYVDNMHKRNKWRTSKGRKPQEIEPPTKVYLDRTPTDAAVAMSGNVEGILNCCNTLIELRNPLGHQSIVRNRTAEFLKAAYKNNPYKK